jgi:hypothetical protein
MSTSAFLKTGITFLSEASEYLDSRGLTIQDLPIEPYRNVNIGFHRKVGADQYAPHLLEGWAFKIRGPDGDYYSDRVLLRPCNWDHNAEYYQKRNKIYVRVEKPPKFVQVSDKGADCINYISTVTELCHAPIVMFHEKFTSAALATNLTHIPSIALSGCTNFSQDKRLKDSLSNMIKCMQPSAKIVVCFDGDLIENPNVMNAASQLKGWIHAIRPDITCTFPNVPTMVDGRNGWDDWLVDQAEFARSHFLALMEDSGVDVTTALPIAHLIAKYQVKVKVTKDRILIEQTAANYRRLLHHPNWENYVQDVGGAIYNREDIGAGAETMDSFAMRYETWLADAVFIGEGAGVRSAQVKQACKLELKERIISIPLLLLSQQPPITHAQAQAAASRMFTEGLRSIGPMTMDETVETMIRCARDMVALWSADASVDIQWVLALVGPSGCGKSNFPKSFLRSMEALGYRPPIAQLEKSGPRASMVEYVRQCRDCLAGVFDEYNPDDKSAKQVEQDIFTLSTTRISNQRRSHEEDSSECLRRAFLMLTTVDQNRTYIRSEKGAGERRFITIEVVGVKEFGGKLSSDRDVITECALPLLVYGYQLYMEGNNDMANEHSLKYVDQYISEPTIMAKIARRWSNGDIHAKLDEFRKVIYRPGTEDYRFSMPMLMEQMLPEENLNRPEKGDFRHLVEGLGAKNIGQARVNMMNGKDTVKDTVYSIKDFNKFLNDLVSMM